jgi:hypothetical protein
MANCAFPLTFCELFLAADSYDQLHERIVRIVKENGKTIATPDHAGQRLRLGEPRKWQAS